MQSTQTTLNVGSIVQNRYVVERLLGKGGFGAVYLVKDRRVKGNLFALKEIIDPEKKERERFTFEGNILARLDHPALPRVYRTFEDDKNARAYMLMDYVEGPNLETLRQQQPEKRFSLERTLKIMSPIVDALNYLHRQRPPVIHRDIKPSNIIVPASEDSSVLVDFGIAKEYDQDSTTTAVRRCSPGYGAPEQYARGTNTRTDVYGLAATCYALLTGQVPADALYRMTSQSSKHSDPLTPAAELVPEIPQHVSEAIRRAMAINSNDRYASVTEFWRAMTAQPAAKTPPAVVNPVTPAPVSAKAPDPVTPSPVVPPESVQHLASAATAPHVDNIPTTHTPPPRQRRRKGALALLLAAIAVLGLVIGITFASGLLPFLNHNAQLHATATVGATSRTTPVSTAPVSQPASTATKMPAATPPATTPAAPPAAQAPGPSSNGATYPTLAGVYTGQISDKQTTPPTNSSMSLNQIQQNGANISGTFTVGPGLQGNGPFSGSVTTDHKIQFVVPSSLGHLPLLFQGTMNGDGSMSGTYCGYQGNYQCNYNASGYGTWNVSPPSPQSNTTLPGPFADYIALTSVPVRLLQ